MRADLAACRRAPSPCRCRAAFLIRSAAGGVLVTKLNERSSKIVISTGMIMPDLAGGALVVLLHERHDVDAVLAEGRADGRRRRGLAGVDLQRDDRRLSLPLLSLPAVGSGRGSQHSDCLCQLSLRDARDLEEVELDRRLAAEERDEHADLALLGVDVVDDADEVGERAVDDLDALALGEADLDLGRLLVICLRIFLTSSSSQRRSGGCPCRRSRSRRACCARRTRRRRPWPSRPARSRGRPSSGPCGAGRP